MSDSDSIITQLAAQVAARKDSLGALRARIAELLAPIPVGVRLEDDAGEVCRIIRVTTGASQWSNRTWDVTIKGKGALTPGGKLICDDLRDSKWDGRNLHHRSEEPTCDEDGEAVLKYEPGHVTRETAVRLSAAIARYMAECAAETAANAAAAEEIGR